VGGLNRYRFIVVIVESGWSASWEVMSLGGPGVSLGAITTGLIVKAVDRTEDDALDAGSGVLRWRSRTRGFAPSSSG
jgi:hypothetical protein